MLEKLINIFSVLPASVQTALLDLVKSIVGKGDVNAQLEAVQRAAIAAGIEIGADAAIDLALKNDI